MRTVVDALRAQVGAFKADVGVLLGKYASIHHEPTREFGGELRHTPWGIQRAGGGIAIGSSAWKPLPPEGVQVQAAALEKYRHFAAVGGVLLREQPQKVLAEFEKRDKEILAAVQQKGPPSRASAEQVRQQVEAAVEAQLGLLASLYDGSDGATIIVPDTNALLFNPNLEDWSFPDATRFTVLLLPTVLAELDKQKVNYRSEPVQKKAEGLVTRIKGYRSRGSITAGVTLRKERSRLLAWALEPNVGESLPWLDAENNDDRILASVVEVMRKFPHSPGALVTRDINLQNKAELVQIPFLEPPDLIAGA